MKSLTQYILESKKTEDLSKIENSLQNENIKAFNLACKEYIEDAKDEVITGKDLESLNDNKEGYFVGYFTSGKLETGSVIKGVGDKWYTISVWPAVEKFDISEDTELFTNSIASEWKIVKVPVKSEKLDKIFDNEIHKLS